MHRDRKTKGLIETAMQWHTQSYRKTNTHTHTNLREKVKRLDLHEWGHSVSVVASIKYPPHSTQIKCGLRSVILIRLAPFICKEKKSIFNQNLTLLHNYYSFSLSNVWLMRTTHKANKAMFHIAFNTSQYSRIGWGGVCFIFLNYWCCWFKTAKCSNSKQESGSNIYVCLR